MSIDYTGTLTVSNIVDRSPSMSAADMIQFRRWAAYNQDAEQFAHPNSPTMENDEKLFDTAEDNHTSWNNIRQGWADGSWNPSKVTDTDWTDYVTQTAVSQEHTLAVSGGTEQMNAYGSFGYMTNKGTQKGQWYDRYTGKVSVNINPAKWFSVQASINGTWAEQDYGMSTLQGRSGSVPDAIYGTAKQIYNFAVPYDEDGNVVTHPGGETTVYTIMNEWNHSQQKSQTFRALSNFSATVSFGEIVKPLKGLRYKISFGPDFRSWREGVYIDGFSSHKVDQQGNEGVNYSRLQNRRDFSWTLDNMIMFDRTFNQKHKVGVTLLQTASKWNIENSSIKAEGLEKDSYLWNAMGTVDVTDATRKVAIGSGLTDRQLESYMIRLNYGIDDLTFTAETKLLFNYVIKYVDSTNGNNVVKTIEGAAEPGTIIAISDEVVWADGVKYYILSDDAADNAVADDNNTVITVVCKPAPLYAYKVTAMTGETELGTLADDKYYEGETVGYSYPRYFNLGGTLYKKDPIDQVYQGKLTLDEDNKAVTVEYDATNITNVVCYVEAEDIAGLAVCNTSTVADRCSMRAGAYATEQSALVKLTPGTYTLKAAAYGGAYTFWAGTDNEVLAIASAGSWRETTSEAFTLEQPTTLTFQGGTGTAGSLDYIILQSEDGQATEVATAISGAVLKRQTGEKVVYNMNGQRVVTPAKGVYVIDGRKVIMK